MLASRRRHGLLPTLLLGLALLPGLAGAETLDLKTCLEIALKESLSLRQAEADVEAARFQYQEAQANLFPKLTTAYSYTRLDAVPTATSSGVTYVKGTQDNYQWSLTLTQPLFVGFSLVTNKKLKELGLANKNLSLELAKLDLAQAVKQAYFGVLLAEKNLTVAEQSVKQLEAQVETARNLYEVGMSPKNDVLQAEVELANAVQNVVKAENAVELAKAQLNNVLRRDVETPVNLEDILDFVPTTAAFRASQEEALQTRPEIKQAEVNIQTSEQSVTLAQADYYPQLNAQAQYVRYGDEPTVNGSPYLSDKDQASLTLSLSFTLWDWQARVYRVETQRAGLLKARHALNALKDLVVLDVKKAILNLTETSRSIAVNKKAIEQAEESLRMSQERYKEQVTTTTEVLDAQTRLSRAQYNYYAALYGYHLAQAALVRAVGKM